MEEKQDYSNDYSLEEAKELHRSITDRPSKNTGEVLRLKNLRVNLAKERKALEIAFSYYDSYQEEPDEAIHTTLSDLQKTTLELINSSEIAIEALLQNHDVFGDDRASDMIDLLEDLVYTQCNWCVECLVKKELRELQDYLETIRQSSSLSELNDYLGQNEKPDKLMRDQELKRAREMNERHFSPAQYAFNNYLVEALKKQMTGASLHLEEIRDAALELTSQYGEMLNNLELSDNAARVAAEKIAKDGVERLQKDRKSLQGVSSNEIMDALSSQDYIIEKTHHRIVDSLGFSQEQYAFEERFVDAFKQEIENHQNELGDIDPRAIEEAAVELAHQYGDRLDKLVISEGGVYAVAEKAVKRATEYLINHPVMERGADGIVIAMKEQSKHDKDHDTKHGIKKYHQSLEVKPEFSRGRFQKFTQKDKPTVGGLLVEDYKNDKYGDMRPPRSSDQEIPDNEMALKALGNLERQGQHAVNENLQEEKRDSDPPMPTRRPSGQDQPRRDSSQSI